MKVLDFNYTLTQFNNSKNHMHRYASFDYCYHYFKTNDGDFLQKNLETSCMYLGFFLASWGMYRSSGKKETRTISHSARILLPIIEIIIAEKYKKLNGWSIDVPNYNQGDNITYVIDLFNKIKESIGLLDPSVTLVTKIMLGVFANVPAFDTRFLSTFKKMYKNKAHWSGGDINDNALECIYDFYQKNKIDIDNNASAIKVLKFNHNSNDEIYSTYNYSIAKIIDMYGYQKNGA